MFVVRKPVWALALVLVIGPALANEAAVETPAEEPTEEGDVVERPAEREVASVTQTLQEDAGVSVQTVCTNCNNADLSLGGLGNEHISMVCDGISVPPGLAQVYLLSILPPTVIDKVTVTRGPGEAELEGGAVGGSIEIERRRPEPGFNLNASTDVGESGWRGSRIDLSGKAGRFGGSLVASIAESDAIDSNGYYVRDGVRIPDDSNELPDFDRDTIDGSVEIEISRNDRVRLGYTSYDESQEGGHAGALYGFLLVPPFDFSERKIWGYGVEFVELERRQYDSLYERSFSSGARFTVSGLYADRSQDVRETRDTRGIPQNAYFIDEDHRHGSVSWDQPVGHRTTMHFGVAGTRRKFDVVEFPGFLQPRLLKEKTEEQGVWVSAETALGGSVELDTGLRWVDLDYEDNENRSYMLYLPLPGGDRLLPRAALTWKPSDPVQLRFSLGAGYRAPEPSFDEVCCGRRYRNNRGVSTEKSWSAGVETIYQPSPRFKLTGSGFVTDFEDLVVKMVSWSNFLSLTYQNTNVSDAQYVAVGVETRYDVTSWMAISGAASWLDAENKSSGDEILVLYDTGSELFPRTFYTDRIPYIVERRGSVMLSFFPPQSTTTIDVSAQYTGDMLIQQFDETVNDPQAQFSDSVFFSESDDFWVTNLALSVDLPSGVSVFAGIDNLSDRVQNDLGDPHFDYKWGQQRGRYLYGGLRYRFASR